MRTIFIALLTLSAPSLLKAQELTLGIASNCKKASLNENLKISATISNQSRDAITLYGNMIWDSFGKGFNIHVMHLDGTKIKPSYLFDGAIALSKEQLTNRDSYSRLEPNSFIGSTLEFSTHDMFKVAGDYYLQVTYNSPVKLKNSPIKLDFWSNEKPTLFSNKIRINITQVGTYCASKK